MPLLEFCWLWIFPWIKLSWHSCSVWDKPGWLNWFWQFLCERLPSFNWKEFWYSYAWSHSFCERRTSFCMRHISKKLCRFLLMFWLALLHSGSYFFILYNHLLHLCAWFFILFHLTLPRFTQSTHLPMFLSLETLTSIIRTGLPILLELITLNTIIISNDLTQMVNVPTRIPDCDSHSPSLLDLFLLTLVFVLPWLSLHWGFLIMLLPQFPSKFTTGYPVSSHRLWLFLCWLRQSLWSFERYSMGGYL